MVVGQDVAQVGDPVLHFLVFLFDFFPFQAGQAAQAHVENRRGLLVAEAEFAHQGLFGDFIGLRFANRPDDFVDVIQRNEQAFQDMGPGQRLFQFKFAAPRNDDLLVIQIVMEDFLQGQDAGMAVDEGQHDDTEGFLKLRVLVQLVQDDVRVRVGPQLDDDAQPLAVRFVPQGRNAVDFLVARQVGNRFDDPGLVDLIGNFRDDNAVLPLRHGLDGRAGAHLDAAAARRVGF